MKKIIYKLLGSLITLALFTTLYAQENPSKRSAKEISENGSHGDQIHAKKIQQKQLQTSPSVIAARDSAGSSTKKSVAGKKARKKR